MSNIIDYISWRGDLSFAAAPFCEADNLVLSMTSFLDLGGIVPPGLDQLQPTYRDAMSAYEALSGGSDHLGFLIPDANMGIMRAAAASRRFSDVRLCGYCSEIDHQAVFQFSATTFLLPDLTMFVAFRGTDDTLTGWKENMNLCLDVPVPAEEHATEYLTRVARSHYGGIRIGGHSKGGHLAIWAAASCPDDVQERIIAAYSNDGPGFLPDFYQSQGYLAVRDRLTTFIPQSSIVGALLDQDEARCIVIRSDELGIEQHNPISWSVLGTSFLHLAQRSRFGRKSDEVLKLWIGSLSFEERREIIQSLFQVLDSSGVITLTEFSHTALGSTAAMVKALRGQTPETKKMMLRLFRLLFRPEGPQNTDKQKGPQP